MKRIIVVTKDSYEIEDNCITWVGSSGSYENEKGNEIVRPNNMPDEINLTLHKLGQCVDGINGDGELSIVNKL